MNPEYNLNCFDSVELLVFWGYSLKYCALFSFSWFFLLW